MDSRVLTIHLIEGTANGIQIAESDNWIGKVFVAPRTDLPNVVKQQEIKDGLGVYVLVGDDPNSPGGYVIYIGQGNVANRLTIHSRDTDKDYWDSKMLVIVAKDRSLNTTDCLYLESRLIGLATESKVAVVKNQTNPPVPLLVAPDRTRVENFLTQIQTLLPVLNINFFTPPVLSQPPVTVTPSTVTSPPNVSPGTQNIVPQVVPDASASTTFILSIGVLTAEAVYVNNQFIVRVGSQANPTEGALSVGYKALRQKYQANGVPKDDPNTGKLVFSQDTPFTSTSAAAAVVCGYNVNGPMNWKVEATSQTYDAWQQAQLPTVSP